MVDEPLLADSIVLMRAFFVDIFALVTSCCDVFPVTVVIVRAIFFSFVVRGRGLRSLKVVDLLRQLRQQVKKLLVLPLILFLQHGEVVERVDDR